MKVDDLQFSVLMSVYEKDDAKHLKEAFLSIYDKQVLKPDEIIIVCDGPITSDISNVIEWFEFTNPNIIKVSQLQN